MHDFERTRDIKRAHQARLLTLPGVHAVGVGAKTINGEHTGRLSIVVFVEEKKKISDLEPSSVIPGAIEGIATDVVATGCSVVQSALTGGNQLWPGSRTAGLAMNNMPISAGAGIGDVGTLGCFAKAGDGRIFALTCHHVVGVAAAAEATQLVCTSDVDAQTVSISGQDGPNTFVVAQITFQNLDGKDQDYDIFYKTSGSQTVPQIVSALIAAINALGVEGLHAAPKLPGTNTIQISSPATLSKLDCFSQGPHRPDDASGLKASVSGTTISLQGSASQASGVYLNLNVDGLGITRGIFAAIAPGETAATIASRIVQKLTAASFPGIAAQLQGTQSIVISGAKQVDCDVTSDVRVGSPKNFFCSDCCKSCGSLIGSVTDADIALDAAVIQLEPGTTYRPQIDDVGFVTGTYDAGNPAPGTIKTAKYGITTQRTTGTITAVDVSGTAVSKGTTDGKEWKFFNRHYSGAISILGDGPMFGDHGDSGSAVVVPDNPNNLGSTPVKVLGLLTAVAGKVGFVSPIGPILSRFNLTLVTGTKMDDQKEVPALAGAPAGAQSMAARAMSARLDQIEREVTATNAGKRYADLVRRHFPEARGLVNGNRRVGAVWRRNGGAEILNAFVNVLEKGERQIPTSIDEKPLEDCIHEIRRVLARYGSPQLAEDLQKYTPPLAALAGLTYDQALDTLRGLQLE